MAGPRKGLLKRRFGPQTSSSSHGVSQPQKSSSNLDVTKGRRSSRSRHVPPLHKSNSSRDIAPPHMSSSTHEVPQPQKLSSSRDVPKRYKSGSSRGIPPPCESSSSRDSLSRDSLMENQGLEEDHLEEDQEIDPLQIEICTSHPQLEENIGLASFGTSITRKESRVLSETRNRRLDKGQFVFEVDECAGRIIGEDSQRFITKGGSLVRDHAKFDGKTWRNQSDVLRTDIINKCTENSNYDPNCRLMVRAIHTQLANQHKNKMYRLHVHYKKFSTKDEAIRHPPNGITSDIDWVKLCEKFASEEFQKLSAKNKKNRSMNEVPPAVGTVSIARIVDKRKREGEQVSAIEQYKIGHFSTKKNKMVNEKANEIWNELLSEETTSCSPIEICLKKLHRIPGHIKGRAAPTKQILATENLQMELELEKEKSKTLEEEVKRIKEDQAKFQEEQNQMKDKMKKMMAQMSKFYSLGFAN